MPPSPRRRSLFILLATALLAAAYSQSTTTFPNCDRTFSCGDITNVGFPFTGGDRPSHCGLPEFALTCRDNSITELTDDAVAYRVLRIDQTQKTLILSRSDLYNNTCAPEFRNAALNTTLFSYRGPQNEDLTLFYGCNWTAVTVNPYNLFRCNSSRFNFTDAYYITGPVTNDLILRIMDCSVNFSVALLRAVGNQLATRQLTLQQALMQGFTVNYTVPHERLCSDCKKSGGECGFDSVRGQPVCICDNTPCPVPLTPSEGHQRSLKGIIIGLVVSSTCIILVVIIIYWYLKRRRSPTRSNHKCSLNLEKILHEQGSLSPKRYKYSEIKKITKSFSHKLGQGGYGSVYKGMLPNGSLVAVKVLFETKGNGEEFINEVATISKTSHVNIVNLLGFCCDRSKRALVYEFMPNKSLDKFISNDGSSSAACHLDLGKLYKIAIGVARGLEYLHTGCSTRIVHFDIKPHNILLDEDFYPKISDFGLAKLCKKKESIMSMLIARGTVGYIAPEMFYCNFGGVSHKSDVYSYGMMVLEMAGAKNGSETKVVQSSENYFPDRIYEQVILDITKIEEYAMIEEEEERAKKMFLVGFWCIQTNPSDRPSMTKVVEMLQGSLQTIQIPPKSFLFCPKLSSRQLSSLLSMHVETERAT